VVVLKYIVMPGGFHETTVPWEDAETLKLMQMCVEVGNRWKDIGKQLGRSQNSVRNKFQRIQKGRMMVGEKGQKCKKCGMNRRGHICQSSPSPTGVGTFPFPDYPVSSSEDECEGLDTNDVLNLYELADMPTPPHEPLCIR
jgi:hypothetical protein